MAPAQLAPVLQHVRTLVNTEGMKSASDGELVRQFVASRDEGAFAELLRRHGPMVQSVCRRVLGHQQDAEDAFQATFLVLARRAGSIRRSGAVGAWVYQVAHRIAMKAGRDVTRRQLRQERASTRSPTEPASEAALRELQAILQEEVNRLPDKYRAPFVLCCLEGKSGVDAARQLGWKEGTVSGRLTEARKLLRSRLTKRGVNLAAALCAVHLPHSAITAAASASLGRATLKAALSFAAGRVPADDMVSGQSLALAQWLLRVASTSRVMTATIFLLMLSLLGVGLGLACHGPSPVSLLPPQAAFAGAPQKRGGDKAAASRPAESPAAPPVRVDRFGDPLPEGAVARFGTVRLRQGWMASRVLFSPDGKKLAVAGLGRPLGLWDVANGKEIRQFHQKDIQASGVDFSPDGTLLAEGHFDVRLWDTKTGVLRHALGPAQASQRAVVFTPDGKTVISGGHDNLIHSWNVQSGDSLGKLEGHTNSVLTLAVTKDGSTLASGGSDQTIRLWDLAGRRQIREIKGAANKEGYFHGLSFSPDGRWLASVENDGNAPGRVWDVRTGKERFQLGRYSSHAYTVAFSPDGKLIASGHGDGAIRLWDPATGKELRHWSCQFGVPTGDMAHGLRNLAFSPNSKTLATASVWECGPRLWDVATGTEIRTGDTHRGSIRQVCLTRDGKSLLSLSHDQQLMQWDLANKTPRRLMELPFGTRWNDYYQLLSPDGRVLAQGSRRDRTVTLIDPQMQKPLKDALQLQDEPYALCFSADGRTLAVGCQKGSFYLWNWQRSASPRRIETPEKDLVIIHLFTPDGKQVLTGSRSQNNLLIHLWDVATGKRVLSFPGNNGLPTFAVSPDGKWGAAAAYGDRSIHVIDVVNRKEARTIPLAQPASGLAFSPDSQVLAYGEHERSPGKIGLLELATDQPIAIFQGHHSGVGQLLFSPDGRFLFSGAGDSTILQWDATGRFGKRPFYTNLHAAWDALAGDAKGAYTARWDFVDSPAQAIALFRHHVHPIEAPKPQAFEKLIAVLDSGSFAERQKASDAIKAMGLFAEPLVRKQLEARNSLEVRRRLQGLYDGLMKSPAWLRTRRVLTIVSALPPGDARPFLAELACGEPDAILTIEAKKALTRMGK
jgi:RNA polymerase sigma factor (sigma-70 family)